jgi:hypothetical protein
MNGSVRDTIVAKLRAGVLRRDAAVRTWFGRGQGHPCAGCDRAIEPVDRECEADFPDGATLRFHRECFYVWDEERRASRDERRQPDEACVITSTIMSMALCLPCIVEKTGIPVGRVRAVLRRAAHTVELTQGSGRCAECGLVTTTYRIG